MKNPIETLDRRNVLKLIGIGGLATLLSTCINENQGSVFGPEIAVSNGKWLEITNKNFIDTFEQVENTPPIWDDGKIAMGVDGEFSSIFSAPQVVNVSSGFKEDQVVVRTNYPGMRTLIIDSSKVDDSPSVQTNIDPSVLRSLTETVGEFGVGVNLLIDMDIAVDGEILAKAANGKRGLKNRLGVELENDLVSAMPIVGVRTPREVLWQDSGDQGYYVRVSSDGNRNSQYYRYQAS